MKLLIIEDEEDLIKALSIGLKKSGYIVDTAMDGQEGLDLTYINQYDLIVLDLNLPTLDGLDILTEIRKRDKEIKIIILSARTEYTQRIEGLDRGANDYLVKPFHFGELVARIRSLLRRNFTQEAVLLTCSGIYLDTAKRTAYTKDDQRIDFSPKEFAILEYLLMNKGRAISGEELIEHIWHSDVDMFSNAVKVHMSTLRKKLKLYGEKDVLINIRGAGYLINEEGVGNE
ncbi:MAG: response regulator transcription factor [Turicibacter sp.]